MAPSMWVLVEIKVKAISLLQAGCTRDAIELILQNDLSAKGPSGNSFDAGEMLHKALTTLAQMPHNALGIPIGAQLDDIRKAYKKMALKYHPDKNPKTTLLFHVIQTAYDKLSDPDLRAKEEAAATTSKAPPPSNAPWDTAGNAGNPYKPTPKPAPPTYQTRQEPFKQPVPPSKANYQPNAHPQAHQNPPPQPSQAYSDFERMKNAEEMRKKVAQRAREAERDARFEAVRKAQEINKRAKEVQEQQDVEYLAKRAAEKKMEDERRKEYISQQTKEANARELRERVMREEAARSKNVRDPNPKQENSSYSYSAAQPAPSMKNTNLPNINKPNGGTGQPNDWTEVEFSGKEKGKIGKRYEAEVEKVLHEYSKFSTDHEKYGGFDNKPNAASGSSKPVQPPRPSKLCYTALMDNHIDLEWIVNVPAGFMESILYEVSWRKFLPDQMSTGTSVPWESSGKYIAECRCRKKNLILGAQYEFRVRSAVKMVIDNVGPAAPLPYYKSSWCDSIMVSIPSVMPSKHSKSNDHHQEPSKNVKAAQPQSTTTERTTAAVNESAKVRIHPTDRRTHQTEPSNNTEDPYKVWSERAESIASEREKKQREKQASSKPVKEEPIQEAPRAQKQGHSRKNEEEFADEVDEDDDEEENIEIYDLKVPDGTKTSESNVSVRLEPFMGSKVVGYIHFGKYVEVSACCGDWSKVRCHGLASTKKKGTKSVWGWCMHYDNNIHHRYLVKKSESKSEKTKDKVQQQEVPKKVDQFDIHVDVHVSDHEGSCSATSDDDFFEELLEQSKWRQSQRVLNGNNSTTGKIGSFHSNGQKVRSFRDAESMQDVWFELFDENNNAYYVNERTGESRWEPPEWVAEEDPSTGCTYYVKLNQETAQVLHSTWSKPNFFSKIIRGIPAFVDKESSHSKFSTQSSNGSTAVTGSSAKSSTKSRKTESINNSPKKRSSSVSSTEDHFSDLQFESDASYTNRKGELSGVYEVDEDILDNSNEFVSSVEYKTVSMKSEPIKKHHRQKRSPDDRRSEKSNGVSSRHDRGTRNKMSLSPDKEGYFFEEEIAEDIED